MTQASKSMSGKEWLMLFALSIAWGGSFFFVGAVVHVLPSFTIAVLRVGLAALAFHALLLALGKRFPHNLEILRAFAVMGFLNNAVPFSLIVWGQSQIPSGLASILNATTPLFAVIAAHVLTDTEKLSKARFAGVVIGFAGVAVLFLPALVQSRPGSVVAQIAVLAAAFSYAIAGIYGRRFRRMGLDPIVTATGQVTASTLILLPVALIAEKPWTLSMPSADVWLAIAGLVLISTVIGYLLYFRILETAGATNLMLVTFLIPVSAILLGWLFLNERLRPEHLAGMVLIGCALAVIDGRALYLVKMMFSTRRRSVFHPRPYTRK